MNVDDQSARRIAGRVVMIVQAMLLTISLTISFVIAVVTWNITHSWLVIALLLAHGLISYVSLGLAERFRP